MRLRQLSALLIAVAFTSTTLAEDRIWTGAADNQFLNAANWDGGLPENDEDVIVIDGGENLPVVIPAGTDTITVGGFQLGTSGDASGHVIQNGGTMIVSPLPTDGLFTDFEFKSHIGDQSSASSSWIMNNDAVMLFDAPLETDGFGFDTDGENGFDLEVGAQTGEGVGRLEMHDNALLRLSDDLKIGAEDNGNGLVILTGNAKATIGSGISLGEGNGIGNIQLSGNALLISGNSADPGDSEAGRTNEGYMTFTQGGMTLADSAQAFARTLQHRSQVAALTIGGESQYHVFDVFENAAPDLGNATVTGSSSGPQRTSHIAANADSVFTLTVQDNGVFSLDSDLDDSQWSGFAVAGGSNRGANADGGTALIEVRDQGSFTVQQDLHMTIGTGDAAASTLKVVGPDANVDVNGSLFLALDPDGLENDGDATIHAVITANSHATINVAGDAEIANGFLAVELDGYSPRGGESYTLLQAGTVNGESFLETDFSLAELPEGLAWELEIDGSSVVLSIDGMLEGLLGDYDNMNGLDLADIDALISQIASGSPDAAFDVTGDGAVTAGDIQAWLTLKTDADGVTVLPGDTDLNGSVEFADFLQLSGNFGNEGTWSQGNFDGADGVAFADFLALSGNFGSGAAAQSVPEPTGNVLFGFVLAMGLLVRAKRRA